VKSELIIRAKIKEENFITHNHATEGDFVTVRLTVPLKETAVTDAEAEARLAAEPTVAGRRERQKAEAEKLLYKIHLPTRRRKPKSQMIIISPCVPTCCAGPP
jgi:nucleoid-associated protein YgaU